MFSPCPCFYPFYGEQEKRYTFLYSNCRKRSCSSIIISHVATNLFNFMFYFQTKQLPVPKNPSDKKPVKSETSPVAPRAGLQPKAQPQPPPPQPPHKLNQGLQVPAVSLYPSRKKVPVKDLPPFGR